MGRRPIAVSMAKEVRKDVRLVCLVPANFKARVDKAADENGFIGTAQFVREAIEEKLARVEKDGTKKR